MKATSCYSAEFFKGSESLYPAVSAPKNRFNALLSQLQRFLSSNPTEPRIQHKRDRFGQAYWRTYDPINSQIKYFETEDEVCEWLDNRYYQ